jgi:uncharacterized membrane protein
MNETSISRLERHLGRLLLAGVICSATLLLIGLTLWMSQAAPSVANALLNIGLITLMATPVLRVVVSLVEYARMRDWFFVATTLAVLVVLFVSIGLALKSRGPNTQAHTSDLNVTLSL